MPKPKAERMPGGAPIKAKKKRAAKKKAPAKKRAARIADDDEAPPNKPAKKKAAKKKAAKEKPPCKYGPRTAAGKCPKKPTQFKAAAQHVKTIVSPTASAEQRGKAAAQLGTQIAAQTAAEITRDVKRQLRTKKGKETAKQVAKIAAGAAANIVKKAAVPTVVGGALAAGGALYKASVRKLAADRVAKVEKTLGRTLDANARSILMKQHLEQARKDLTLRAPKYGR